LADNLFIDSSNTIRFYDSNRSQFAGE
jgi:hypothetical protein